jgi:hypothetical protein
MLSDEETVFVGVSLNLPPAPCRWRMPLIGFVGAAADGEFASRRYKNATEADVPERA